MERRGLGIGDMADVTHKTAWPSVKYLTEATQICKRSVQTALANLVNRGLIRRKNMDGKGSDRFTLVMAKMEKGGVHHMHGGGAPHAPEAIKEAVRKKEQTTSAQIALFQPMPENVVTMPIPDARKALWTIGVPALRNLTGASDAQTRKLMGRLLKQAKDDCANVLRAIREATDLQPADPVSWLMRAAKPYQNAGLALIAEEGFGTDGEQSDNPFLQRSIKNEHRS